MVEEKFVFNDRTYAVQVPLLDITKMTEYGLSGPYQINFVNGKIRLLDITDRLKKGLITRALDLILGNEIIAESDYGDLDHYFIHFGRSIEGTAIGSFISRIRTTRPNLTNYEFYGKVWDKVCSIVNREKSK